MRPPARLFTSTVISLSLTSIRITSCNGLAPLPSFNSMSSDFSSNPLLVGSTWTISSSIFTTYFTTAFLKHNEHKQIAKTKSGLDDFESQIDEARKNDGTINRIFATRVLQKITRPQLLTLYRFVGSFLLGVFVHPQMFRWAERLGNTMESMGNFALPAVFLFAANYCNSISLDRIGISLTYTSKCSIPLITVIITLMLNGLEALPSIQSLLSLIPIAIGVAMASWNSSAFDLLGFLAAMGSATSQAALNVVSKRALIKTGIGGLEAQRAMAAVASIISIIFTGIYCIAAGGNKTDTTATKRSTSSSMRVNPPYLLSLAAVMAYHAEYVLSFMFVKLVEPVTYGTCDALRRLLIIISGRLMFKGEAFSMLNRIGIGLALIGAFSYSLAS